MKKALSKTQIDRLGDRLRKGSPSESDLRLLDEYRRSFGEPYEEVIQKLRQHGQFPTGRPAKSTPSIIEKLQRESIRLSQMQDVAGCRVVVRDIVEQDEFISLLKTNFPKYSSVDRRDKPSFGYRAVHFIADVSDKPIEIQVRTALQHLWAEFSEKSSDILDPDIKYGGGDAQFRKILAGISGHVAVLEKAEKNIFILRAAYNESRNGFTSAERDGLRLELKTLEDQFAVKRNEYVACMAWAISLLE